jgi:two-component system KDP operon response regulator KdpE
VTGAQDFDSSILVFEGESKTGMLLRVSHDAEGSLVYETEEVADATVARGVDVILIDMKFRGIGEVVESLRAWSEAPIVITSIGYGHDQSQTAVDYAEFSSGPQFHSGELLVEIRDALKCLVPDDGTVIAKTGELSLNLSDRSVFVRGDPVMLTPTEYELLKLLVINAGHVVTHEQLLGRIWDSTDAADTTRLRIMIRRLREKIELDPSRPVYVKSQPGVGYRLEAPGRTR